jgi:hypothetical protein
MRAFLASASSVWICALLLSLGGGCSMSAELDPAGPGGPSGGSAAGEPSTDDVPDSLIFDVVSDLSAREQITLRVVAVPAKSYRVRFALPFSGGEPLDAILNTAEADTDASGAATVQLTAPSTPTTFEVRANVGARVTSLPIRVKDTGFATLLVQPLYAGFRTITTWVASAYPNKTCADVAGIPPEDGPLQTLPAASDAAPQLNQVPASTPLAVTLRSGHFVGGCASLEGAPPGSDTKPLVVPVTVLDRPIDLGVSSLAVSFGLPAPESSWNASLTATGDDVLRALLGASTDDVDALLDAMRDASGESRQALESARQAESWDNLLRTHWGTNAGTKLHDVVSGWLVAGRQKFSDSEHLFTGTLTPIQQPAGALAQPGADFTLLSVAGLNGAKSGFVDRAQVSWSASSDDAVFFGTDLYFVQSQLAAALAEAAALEASPAAETAAALLADALDCQGISGELTTAGVNPLAAYDACDSACLASLCESAVAAIWRRGGDATGLSPARLSVTATGAAHVGDTAEVAGVIGTWIGELHSSAATRTTGGALSAAEPVVAK